MTRFAVRRTTYRGEPGYLVYSQRNRGRWPQRIFTRTLGAAMHIKARCNAGLDIGLADFADRPDPEREAP